MTRLGIPVLAAALWLMPAACAGGGARTAGAPASRAERSAEACPPADSAESADADIAITATARARELRHAEAPRTATRVTGTALADSLSCDTRSNLERPARAGRTYRDVRIDYRLRVRIDTAAAFQADTTGRPRAEAATSSPAGEGER